MEDQMDNKMEDKARSNEVNLFGQKFHACVGVTYVGLGIMMGNGFHRWFPGGTDWPPLIGLVMLFGGSVWWLLRWRGQRTGA